MVYRQFHLLFLALTYTVLLKPHPNTFLVPLSSDLANSREGLPQLPTPSRYLHTYQHLTYLSLLPSHLSGKCMIWVSSVSISLGH